MTMVRTVIVTGFLICMGVFFLAAHSMAQQHLPFVWVSRECGPVTDTTFVSPSHANTAHLLNQYCASGFGNADDPYWIVISDDVATAGIEDRVQLLGAEDRTVFKAWDHKPVVSWQDDEHLVIQVVSVSRITKSLHVLGSVRVSYKISEALSEEKFLRAQRDYEERPLTDFKSRKSTFVGDPKQDVEVLKGVMASNLKSYRVFQAWVKGNVE